MYEDRNKVVVMISVIVLTNGRFKHLIPRVREKQQSTEAEMWEKLGSNGREKKKMEPVNTKY